MRRVIEFRRSPVFSKGGFGRFGIQTNVKKETAEPRLGEDHDSHDGINECYDEAGIKMAISLRHQIDKHTKSKTRKETYIQRCVPE
jgi:hypothetical protein